MVSIWCRDNYESTDTERYCIMTEKDSRETVAATVALNSSLQFPHKASTDFY